MPILAFDRVNKSFGAVKAVEDLSFAIEAGSIFGFLGANGAGKTTSLRMILDILRPDSGQISVFGQSPSRDTAKRIGYLPEERGLYGRMSVIDNLLFFARLRGMTMPAARRASDEILTALGLAEHVRKPVKSLSKGNAQKLQLAATLIGEPPLLLLDEPFSGLDPVAQNDLEDLLRAAAGKGATIVFSTHVMSQAEKLCQSLLMLARGRLLFAGTLAQALAATANPAGGKASLHDMFLHLNGVAP